MARDVYDGTQPPKRCRHTADLFGDDALPRVRFVPKAGGQWDLLESAPLDDDDKTPPPSGGGA